MKYSNSTKMNYLWVLLCCLGSGVIAAIYSSNRCLWADELVTLITVRRPFMEGLLQLVDYSAPLHQLILRLIVHNAFPPEWVIRAPAFLFALLGLVSIWWLAKTLFDTRVAALSIFIVAFNPVFLDYAAEGRPYTMFLFFSAISIGTFYKFILYNSPYYLFFYVCSSVLLIYSHYYGLLIFPAEVLLFLTYIIMKRNINNIKEIISAFCAVGIFSIPALWMISRYIDSGLPGIANWLETPRLKSLFFFDIFRDKIMAILCIWAFIMALIAVYNSLKGHKHLKENIHKVNLESLRSSYLSTLICFYWIGTSFYSLLFISYFFKPLFYVRYVLPAIVPCAILLSVATCKMPRSVQILVFALIVASIIPQLRTQLADVRNDYSEVVSQLRKTNPDNKIVHVAYFSLESADSTTEYGLRYYGYNEPNIVAGFGFKEARLLQTDGHYFIVDELRKYENDIYAYLKETSREYKIMEYGHLTLFEVK